MAKRQIFVALLGALLLLVVAIVVSFCRPPAITGQAMDTNFEQPASAIIQRDGSNLNVELSYFPSFESTFADPQVFQDGAKVVVLLRSYRPGIVQRKSEQKTNLSFKISAVDIPSGTRVHFRSEDYDQVFAVGVAP